MTQGFLVMCELLRAETYQLLPCFHQLTKRRERLGVAHWVEHCASMAPEFRSQQPHREGLWWHIPVTLTSEYYMHRKELHSCT